MRLAIVLVAALGAFAAPSARSAVIFIDQSNIVDVAGSAVPIAGGGFGTAFTGQTFTPTFNSMNAVDFALVDMGSTIQGAEVTLFIRQAGSLGLDLAMSELLVLPDGFGTLGSGPVAESDVAHFVFATPVALTPGVEYLLHFWFHGGDPVGFRGVDADTYAGGNAVVEGNARLGADAWFVLGLDGEVQSVPEPSSLMLLGAGLAAMAMYGRRRRPRKLQAITSRSG